MYLKVNISKVPFPTITAGIIHVEKFKLFFNKYHGSLSKVIYTLIFVKCQRFCTSHTYTHTHTNTYIHIYIYIIVVGPTTEK